MAVEHLADAAATDNGWWFRPRRYWLADEHVLFYEQRLIAHWEHLMKSLHWTCLVLVIVGALNWGLVGLFEFDLVAALFGGQDAALSRLVYTLVGISGVVVAGTSASMARHVPAHAMR